MTVDAKTAIIIIEAGKVVEVRKWGTLEDFVRGSRLGADDPPESFWPSPRNSHEVDWLEVEFSRDFKAPGSRPYRDDPVTPRYHQTVTVDLDVAGEPEPTHRKIAGKWMPMGRVADAVRQAYRQTVDFERSFARVRELLNDDERRDGFVSEVVGSIRRRIKGGNK